MTTQTQTTDRTAPFTARTLDAAMLDYHTADLRARQLRAQAVSEGLRAFAGWVARRWSALRGAGARQAA